MTDTLNQPRLNEADLAQFTGTEQWHRHGFMRSVLYTDGAKYVADTAGAYWLIDDIAFAQADPRIAGEDFQVWKLAVRPDTTATLTCEDGNGRVVCRKDLTFTSFPEPGIDLWYSGGVIYLPSEH